MEGLVCVAFSSESGNTPFISRTLLATVAGTIITTQQKQKKKKNIFNKKVEQLANPVFQQLLQVLQKPGMF